MYYNNEEIRIYWKDTKGKTTNKIHNLVFYSIWVDFHIG